MNLSPRLALLVFAGGALGSLARFEIGTLLPNLTLLLLVNAVGTFVLGVVNGDSQGTDQTRAFMGAGFAGGFTTMSGVSLVISATSIADFPLMLLYLAAMGVLAVASYRIGLTLFGGGKR